MAMTDERPKASLSNLFNGGAIEMFDNALAQAVENIEDINTSGTKPRKVILTLTLTPNKDDRSIIKHTLKVDKKIEEQEPVEGLMDTVIDGNGAHVVERAAKKQPLQLGLSLPDDGEGKDGVVPMRKSAI
ncbi:MAG: hypothetical protein RBT11_19850 [Desulfobacterales bacterium]|jgi:hypothetical protein|nr:hypothetical protein [Desulfobacterales bacterium]